MHGLNVKKLVLSVISVFFAVGATELTLRNYFDDPYFTNRNVDRGMQNEIWRYMPDSDLGYRLRLTETSQHGFQNGAEYSTSKKGAIDLALLGDSLLHDEQLRSVLQSMIDETEVRVWNIGTPGFNTLQEELYFRKYVTLHPDILVLSFCLNDFLPSMVILPDNDQNTYFANTIFDPLFTAHPFLYQKLALYRRYVRLKLSRRTRDIYSPQYISDHIGAVEAPLRRLQLFCKLHNIQFLVMVYPVLDQHLMGSRSYEGVAHETVLKILNRNEVNYLDLTAVFQQQPDMALRRSADDHYHPNRAGHELAAKALIQKLKFQR